MTSSRLPTQTGARVAPTAAWVALVSLVAAGCTGTITDPHGTGDGGTVGDGGGDGGTLPTTCTTPVDPAPPYMRRLTNNEYARTVRDLLGETNDPTTDFPEETYNGGFDNNVASLHLSAALAERYMNAAETLSHSLLASAPRRAMVLGCDPATTRDRAGCLHTIVTGLGRRAWRRPLEAAEVTALETLAATHASDPDPTAGVALVIQALLQSPNFLFRIEVGTPDPAHPGLARLTGLEMASRLSYLLWSSTPDEALLDAADQGHLDTADGVAQMARTMLADPRAHEAMQEFYGQWLRLYELDDAAPDPMLFPAWNDGVRAAMREEARRFIDDFIWTDGANFLDLLVSRYTYVTPELAAVYSLPAPPPGRWGRVTFADTTQRGGLLSQGAFLAGHARPDSDSPTRRGKYVREVLLCQTMPAPPPDVPALMPALPGQSERDRLTMHRTNPACSGCHSLMDPVGLGLERFDAIGRMQDTDRAGHVLTGAGEFIGISAGTFTGAVELGQHLRAEPRVPHCIAEQTTRYAFGRGLGPGDTCAVDQVAATFASSGYSFRAMVVALVQSDAFRYVHPGAPEIGGGS